MPTDESLSAATASEQQQEPAPDSGLARLHLTGISKRFGAVRAIRNADLTVRTGQVHALVGENGAGKSTMIKIISGVESADTGRIEFEGAEVSISSTTDAMALGIATVYQEPQLFAELTVSENIFTGREIRKGGRVDWAAQNDEGRRTAGTAGAARQVRHRGGRRRCPSPSSSRCRSPRRWPVTPRSSSWTSRRRSSPTPRSMCCSPWFAGSPHPGCRSSTSRTGSTSCSASPSRSP